MFVIIIIRRFENKSTQNYIFLIFNIIFYLYTYDFYQQIPEDKKFDC